MKEKNIDQITTIYGYVSEEKKFLLFEKAWVLIHPSIREGWGLNVIEANGVRTPAVGYNVTGLRDSILDNQTGLLAQQSIESLVEKTYDVLSDKKLRDKLSHAAYTWARSFSWQNSGEKSWKLIKEKIADEKTSNLH